MTEFVKFVNTGADMAIEASKSLVMLQDVRYEPPPPKVIPLRHFRAVMNDYRLVNGVPVDPPILDCGVPVLVTLDPKGVGVPDDKRPLPNEIKTNATLRWFASSAHVSYSPDVNPVQMLWTAVPRTVPWTSWRPWQPVLDENYGYTIPHEKNALELLPRPALVFQPDLGSCMNTVLSINSQASVQAIEFWLVLWTHPFTSGQNNAHILGVGDPVESFGDMPFEVYDKPVGNMNQRLWRPNDHHLRVNQGQNVHISLDLPPITSGRPILVRVVFGQKPRLEWWGPKGRHGVINTPTAQRTDNRVALATNYILGRQRDIIRESSNAGMHLFEINYFDHAVTDIDPILHSLDACYAITAAG